MRFCVERSHENTHSWKRCSCKTHGNDVSETSGDQGALTGEKWNICTVFGIRYFIPHLWQVSYRQISLLIGEKKNRMAKTEIKNLKRNINTMSGNEIISSHVCSAVIIKDRERNFNLLANELSGCREL